MCAFCFLSRSPRENLVADVGKAKLAAGSAGGGIILVVPGREGEWGYQFDLSVGDYQCNDVVEALGRAGGWSGPNELDVRGNEGLEGMLRVLSSGAGADPRAGRLSRSVGEGLRLKQAVGFYKVRESFDLEWYRSTHFNSSMISMKNILKRLIVLSEDMIEEEVVKCLLPQLMVMENCYSATLPPFVPEVPMKNTLVKVLVLVTGCSL